MGIPVTPGNLLEGANDDEIGDAGEDEHYAEDGRSERIEVKAGFRVWLECLELEKIVRYFLLCREDLTTHQSDSFAEQEDDVLLRDYRGCHDEQDTD